MMIQLDDEDDDTLVEVKKSTSPEGILDSKLSSALERIKLDQVAQQVKHTKALLVTMQELVEITQSVANSNQQIIAERDKPKKLEAVIERDANQRMTRVVVNIV